MGTLYIVGTPIGNREDISLRALRILNSVDIILCEDTRMTDKLLRLYPEDLLKSLGISSEHKHLVRFDESAEKQKTPEVIRWLEEGKNIALVSDAGMPLISDPGFVLVRECQERGVDIEVVPGPTAMAAAVAIAGMPVHQLLFLGFLPKKGGKRNKVWEGLRQIKKDENLSPTAIFYESPFRIQKLVEEIGKELEAVEVAAVGEITKLHEKVFRGTPHEVAEKLKTSSKGEWVVLVRMS